MAVVTADELLSPLISIRTQDGRVELFVACEAFRQATDGALITMRVVGLELEFSESPQHDGDYDATRDEPAEECTQLLSHLIEQFHSSLATFPHLRVASVVAPLPVLRHAVRLISTDSTRVDYLIYHWGCRRDYRCRLPVGEYTVTGVNRPTLEPSGRRSLLV